MPRRAAGAAIDGLVFSVPVAVVGGALLGVGSTGFAVVAFLASALYLIPQIALAGQTIGSRVVGVRLDAVSTGSAPGWARSVARWAPMPLSAVLGRVLLPGGSGVALALIIVMYAPALPDSRRRAIQDRLAGIVVLNVD